LWHTIDVGKADQSKAGVNSLLATFTTWMYELQQIVKLDCKNILNYLCCERRSAQEVILITEMITRGSLRNFLVAFRHPKMSICQAWFRQILSGLQSLHRRNITHGGLTCEHIYINSNAGELKIGDLSLVKLPGILADRVTFQRPVDDIHYFGLMALEIAFAQRLSSSGLQKLMSRFYDAPAIDKGKIEKLLYLIEDPLYRSLIAYSVFADSSITAENILSHAFFSTLYGKDELLRISREKIQTREKAAISEIPPKRVNLAVTYNTLKTDSRINSTIINTSIRIISGDVIKTINFSYDMDVDRPEKLAQEMRTLLKLPEAYVLAIQSSIAQSGIFAI